ncbi:hypothetical protein A2U01_0028963, partial [Trifolium medium]|nr:hypothetical protein [Trifolium medium]
METSFSFESLRRKQTTLGFSVKRFSLFELKKCDAASGTEGFTNDRKGDAASGAGRTESVTAVSCKERKSRDLAIQGR